MHLRDSSDHLSCPPASHTHSQVLSPVLATPHAFRQGYKDTIPYITPLVFQSWQLAPGPGNTCITDCSLSNRSGAEQGGQQACASTLGHPQNHTCTVRLALHFQVHCRQTELVVLLQSCWLLGALHGAPHAEPAPHGCHLLVELLPSDFVVKSQPAELYFHPVGLERA